MRIAVIVGLFAALCATSVAATTVVSYTTATATNTIRTAISSAASDTKFVFGGGVYVFSTTIVLSPSSVKNSITLEGSSDPSNPTVFRFSGGIWGLQVDRISGLTVSNIEITTTSGSFQRGFKIAQSSNVVLQNCKAYGGTRAGFDLNTVNGGQVKDCHSYNNGGHGFSITDVQNVAFTGNKANGNSWFGISFSNAGTVSNQPNSGVTVDDTNDFCTGNVQGSLQLELNAGNLNTKITTWNGQNVLGKQIPMTFTYFHSALLNAVRPNDQNGLPVFGFGGADGFSSTADVDVHVAALRYLVVRNSASSGLATKSIGFFCTAPASTDDTGLAAFVAGAVDPVVLDGLTKTFYVSDAAGLTLDAASSSIPPAQSPFYNFRCGSESCDLPIPCGGDCQLTIQCPNMVYVESSTPKAVTFPAATASSQSGIPITITYSPDNGSVFPVGTTRVTATAHDVNDATASCTFEVCVSANPEQCYNNVFVSNTGGSLCLSF